MNRPFQKPASQAGPAGALSGTGLAARAARHPLSGWFRSRRFILVAATLVLFLASLINSFVKTQTLEERISNQVNTAMWLVSQAEIEYLRFLDSLQGYHHGDPQVPLSAVTQRFEILWSRLPLLLEGVESMPLRSMLQDGLEKPVRALLADLEVLEPVVFSLEQDDTPAVDMVRSTLAPYGPDLHQLVIETRRQSDWRSGLYLVRDITLYLEVGPSLTGLLLSGALLVILLVREIRRGDELLGKSQVAERALLDARNFAEQANAAKSRFLIAANHDLRQPLQALSLYAAALRGAGSEPERGTICGEMSGAIEAMGNLLDALLDIGNLEEGRVKVKRTDFAATDLLDSLAREFNVQANGKDVDLRIVPSRLVMHSDPVLLARIVQNFISNAVSYTERGKIVVGCRPRGAVVRIEVWDSGVGIPESKLSSIFEDYYQVDNPARDRRKGLGLGLAIARRVADLLGHRIDVRSRVGRGSMFAVEVPFVRWDERVPDKAVAPRTDTPELQEVVLVAIDDDPAILDGMGYLLSRWGARFISGATASEALEELYRQRLRPDFVIADYRLAVGATGLGAVRSLRAVFGEDLPAVIITGDTSPVVTREIKASGCGLVHKPIDPMDLRELIEEQVAAGRDNEAVRVEDPFRFSGR